MILRAALRLCVILSVTGGALVPAFAQGIPLPQPRPVNLSGGSSPSVPAATPGAAPALTMEALAASRSGDVAPSAQPVALATQAKVQAQAIDVGPPPGAQFAVARTPATPAQSGTTLSRVNTYFNSIRTLVGNFSQVAPDGTRTTGKFFLAKPGRIRFYYQAPSTTDIIADGKSVVVRDRKLATQDVYPLSQTPLKFLLDPNLDLSRDSKVVGVREENGFVSVALEEASTLGGKSRVLLVFGSDTADGFELKQWTITDPQGLDTTISVSDLDMRSKPDDKLFKVDYTRYTR